MSGIPFSKSQTQAATTPPRGSDPVHLSRSARRVLEDLHDELGQHGLEGGVLEWESLGGA